MFKNIAQSLLTSFIVIAVFFGVFKTFTFSKDEKKEKQEYKENFKSEYNIYAVPQPSGITFCGENVPTEKFDVKESLDRELLVNTYWQSNSLLLFKRAARWFPIIEPILKKNNIPEDFKYLAVIESGLENVRSPSGARGFWQIMTTTGKELKLEIRKDVDERYHLEKATQAACKYLKTSYAKFGNWTSAAAAYNLGRGGVNNQLKRQKMTSYYDLYLNRETARYVYRIIALKILMENPQDYGFNYRDSDLYEPLPYYEVVVDSTIENLAEFAVSEKSSYKYLKILNPWLRTNTLQNASRKKYTIKFPRKDILRIGDFEYLQEDSTIYPEDNPE